MNLQDLTRSQVQGLADNAGVFRRGEEYWRGGAVHKFRLGSLGHSIRAKVSGSSEDDYSVKIDEMDGDLHIQCDCPYDGFVCKHAIAVLLYYLNERETGDLEETPATDLDSPLGQALLRLDQTELVKLLLRLGDDDEDFKRTLLDNLTIPAQVIRQQPTSPTAVWLLERQINDFFARLPDIMEEQYYHYEGGPIPEIDDFYKQIKTLNPQDQLELHMYLLEKGNALLDEYGLDADQFGQGLVYYAQAVNLLEPTPAQRQEQIERLIETLDELDLGDYEGGMEKLKEALEALATGPEIYRFIISRLMPHEAEHQEIGDWLAEYYHKLGDEKNYLAVRQNHLNTPADYVELAEFWRDKGQPERYITTLEGWLTKLEEANPRGYEGYWGWQTQPTIFERLATHYRETGDDNNLLRVWLDEVRYASPSLDLFKRIEEVARRKGNWEATRAEFLHRLKAGQDRLRAEIYLYEQNWDGALLVARQPGIYNQEEIKALVADGLKEARPQTAIELYDSLVTSNIEQASRKYYQQAAAYAAKIKQIYLTILKDPATWQAYIERIRRDNVRRRALQEEFKGL